MQGFLLLVLLCIAGCGAATRRRELDSAITSFLHERAAWKPICLYTFDDPAITGGATVTNLVPGDVCPFDTLQPDNELVTSLNTASSFWQLGVHLAEDPNNDTKRVQLSSISSVSARDFFTMAAVRNSTLSEGGVTFEMVIRPRAKINHSMTLFSIANEYDNCADSGFRLDVNEHQVLAFIYFLPVLEEVGEAGVEACYEQRLFSVDNSAVCQLPPQLDPVERTPPVHITVTLDPSSTRGLWKTDFYMSYTDVETMQRVDCAVHDEQHPPNTQLLNNLIEGRYRLHLGNSPRNVTFPRQRKHLAAARDFQPLGNTSNLNATERLRAVLKQKLVSISGPRLPKAMRIFGDNSLSLQILGITFPPLNEDTPLAYLRSKFADFKEQYGDQIVEYLVNLVQQQARGPVVMQQSQSSDQSSDGSGEFSRVKLFQGADSAAFDIFHFGIYRRVVSEDQVNSISRRQLLPSRQFPSLHQTVRIPEDSLVLLNLTMFHGVFNDLRLELREIPEFGQLLLFPSKTVVTSDNMGTFQKLPLEHQHNIFFQPQRDQNNENLPLPNPVAFSRRLEPYATVRFGIADSLAGRVVNKTAEARIDIFVDAVNDAPRPCVYELEVRVEIGVPVTLDLKGDDVDGSPFATDSKSGSTDSNDLLSSFTYTDESTDISNLLLLKIVRLPQFGKLYDCNTSCGVLDLNSLESIRVYRNGTEIANATHSTKLMYVYHGWGQDSLEQNRSASLEVDELWYQLSDGDPGIFSDVAVVKFILVDEMNHRIGENVVVTIRLEEDSLQTLNLRALDPLAAFSNANTVIKVTTLPQHGTLFQFKHHQSGAVNFSLENLGARITVSNTIVADHWSRIIYVPQLDYFNLNTQALMGRESDVDYFEYHASNTTPPINDSLAVYENSPTAHFANDLEIRRVEFDVVNVPDALIALPPFIITANLSDSYATPTPVVFEDPDSISVDDMYQVNLEAEDGVSMLELGFPITDDDVMTGCPFDRPCTLVRSTNGTHLNASSNDTQDKLYFHITTQLYDPSHIQVTGTKTALSTALSALTFRGISLDSSRKTEFIFWVKRVNASNDTQQAEVTFMINSPVGDVKGSTADENLVSTLNSQFERYTSTLLVLLAGWLVLSNASCLSIGFCCCCCCTKARKKRRQKFEQQQRVFQAQVAQNDYEYSVLLMNLADLLLEPNLLVSRCVLESCLPFKRNRKQTEILVLAFILRSLLPLLESERQGTRFVFQLMAIEYSEGMTSMRSLDFRRQEFLTRDSTASKALACFSRIVGATWISELLVYRDEASALSMRDTVSGLEKFIDKLAAQVETLPVEIVVLCRACVKLFRRNERNPSREMKLDAVHLVFFNHFIGPVLLFPGYIVSGSTPSTEQQSTLRAIAYRIVAFTDQWRSAAYTKPDEVRSRSSNTDSLLGAFSSETQSLAACRHKYEAVLEIISQSLIIESAFDPNEAKADVDCELMGMYLMNVHSLLDSYFPEFKRRMLQTQTSADVEQIQSTIARVNRLLKALDWPLASTHELTEYARSELLNDPVLWNGFSFQEWEDRAQTQQQQQPCQSGTERTQSLLAHQVNDDEEAILDEDGSSPHGVDWINHVDVVK
ncbi:hypothetical protein F441_05661 [Phytophthora nicotianae CJ01A1]|uniref:Ras-GAP domain-containing protein n=1 Tax=Phytophthora nicotianae CJ01A1 TaxID=1317063 RepID=W2XE95_PHYNI|nr:hypothetical protein F441_05661 [Phytophthora nicotianae CJ01A1]